MRLQLVMIVKNESARIERALASVAPLITSWMIVDTGSIDNTKEKIIEFFKARGVPGEIRDEPFVDWSQARNAALGWARKLAFVYEPTHYLLMDADMELIVRDKVAFLADKPGASFEMYQHAGSVHYTNTRLVSVQDTGVYRGVTHEYYDGAHEGKIDESVAFFYDHADGANRPEKFKRDIALLKEGLKHEPDNVRYFYYLANSYRDAGQPEKAAKWFLRRVVAGGWDEEVWSARVNLAHCHKAMGHSNEFIRILLDAYNSRPKRAEPMYDLAHWYREQPHAQAAALACAEAVEHLPKPDDILFVNDFVYKAGIKEEIAICSWYVPGKRAKGFQVCADLAQQKSNYWGPINTARQGIYHYIQPLSEWCPSFKWRHINFTPPDDWVAMNPSVCVHHEALHVNVRCVNYRIDDAGRYLIRHTETGEITNDNPINTRNFVLYLGNDPFTPAPPWAFECYRDGNMPVEFPLVVGFEDMRIWSKDHTLWSSATVRQLHHDGQCEQVLSRLVPLAMGISESRPPAIQHRDVHRMLRAPRECEKNWAPILCPDEKQQLFMWRPGTVVNAFGETLYNTPPDFAVDNLSGSSQVIPWRDGYIAVLHTACPLPGESCKRYYSHRFITYDRGFRATRLSLPFYFNEKAIEFCAGLCGHPSDNQLVLSYGFKDCEARIATVGCDDVERFLCAS